MSVIHPYVIPVTAMEMIGMEPDVSIVVEQAKQSSGMMKI
jgi:hypothetical protein